MYVPPHYSAAPGDEPGTRYLSDPGCRDSSGRELGGFDDGKVVRRITRANCQAVQAGPIRVANGATDVFAACNG